MGIKLVAASTQFLNRTPAPLTAYPYTVAFWFFFTNNANYKFLWGIYETADANNKIALYTDNGFPSSFQLQSQAAGTSAFVSPAMQVTADNSWHYVVIRLVSNTNRWLSVLYPSGASSHTQNVTSNAPAYTTPREAIGAYWNSDGPLYYHNGIMAEFVKINADIQADGAQLQDWMLRQLAYQGPFSVPHLRKNIIEYRSFRGGPPDFEEAGVAWGAGKGPQFWTNTNSVQAGPHPPLAGNYRRPGDGFAVVIV